MILVELSKLLKDGKIDRNASRSSQFLQLVDAVFDEAAKQMTIEEQDEDTALRYKVWACPIPGVEKDVDIGIRESKRYSIAR